MAEAIRRSSGPLMRLLLDTHLLLWALSSPMKLSKETRRLIDTSGVYVSAASIWEISIKASLGKLGADPTDVLNALEPVASPCFRSWASTPREWLDCRCGTKILSIAS
jgi:hypothetical protein